MTEKWDSDYEPEGVSTIKGILVALGLVFLGVCAVAVAVVTVTR